MTKKQNRNKQTFLVRLPTDLYNQMKIAERREAEAQDRRPSAVSFIVRAVREKLARDSARAGE